MDKLWDAYQTISSFAYTYDNEFIIVVAALLFIGMAAATRKGRKQWYLMKKKARNGLRGKIMTKEEILARDKQIQGDAIFDALMKLVDDGKQTHQSVKNTLRRLATVLSMPDFIATELLDPQNLTTEEFELIQGILRSKQELQKLLFQKQKPRIPGAKPGEIDNVYQYSPRDHARAKELAKASIPKVTFGGSLLRKAAVV